MRFVCLGTMDETVFHAMSKDEQSNFMELCFQYDDELRRGGHFVDGEALQSADQAVTLRSRNGELLLTDGPFAETKEMLGGLLFLEARDLQQAIALISRHPGIRIGAFEIRPVNEQINELFKSRGQKQSAPTE